MARKNRVGLTLVGCIQNALLGGILFGWASVDRTMLGGPTSTTMMTTSYLTTMNGNSSDINDNIDNNVHKSNIHSSNNNNNNNKNSEDFVIVGESAGMSSQQTADIFSWASGISMISSLILGHVLDKYGPRTCSVLSCIIIAVGCQMFVLSNEFEGYAIATCLISFGGPGIGTSIVHVSNLFSDSDHKFLVVSCLTGSVALSFSILALFDEIWERQYRYFSSFRNLFEVYFFVVVACGVISFFLWPDEPFEEKQEIVAAEEQEEEEEQGLLDCCDKNKVNNEEDTETVLMLSAYSSEISLYDTNTDEHDEENNSSNYNQMASTNTLSYQHGEVLQQFENFKKMKEAAIKTLKKKNTFQAHLFSFNYLKILVNFIVTSFLANFYVASVTTELADLQEYNNERQHQLAESLTSFMSFGVLASVLIGVLMDRWNLETCEALTLVLGIANTFLFTFSSSSYSLMIIGFFLYTLFRQFLYAVFVGSLIKTCGGFRYFGVLCGIGFFTSGIAQLFMSDLIQLVQGTCHLQLDYNDASGTMTPCTHGLWKELHVVQLFLLIFLLVIPITEYVNKRSAAPAAGGDAATTLQQPPQCHRDYELPQRKVFADQCHTSQG